MTSSTLKKPQEACFQFKASLFPCTILQITHYDLDELEHQISAAIRRAPNFFMQSSVIIDLEKIKTVTGIDFAKLKRIVSSNNMIPIGIRGASEEQEKAALTSGLTMLTPGKPSIASSEKETKNDQPILSKIVTVPVRSGMQIYAKESDLIVLAAVSPGAELFADGNIHVYGALRGRALAGVSGNKQARIFCHILDAELVSIAGYYLTKDNIPTQPVQSRMVQIYLINEQVQIEAI